VSLVGGKCRKKKKQEMKPNKLLTFQKSAKKSAMNLSGQIIACNQQDYLGIPWIAEIILMIGQL